MSEENLSTVVSTNEKNKIVTSTVVTKRNQESVTRCQIISRTSASNSITGEIMDAKPDSMDNGTKTSVRTVTTFTRKTIKKTGPDGVVSIEIIEEGDPINNQLLPVAPQNFDSVDHFLPMKSISCEDINRIRISGSSNFQASASFNSISDTGEKETANFSTGPYVLMNLDRTTVGDNDDTLRVQSMRAFPSNNLESTEQKNLTVGPTITTKFMTTKSATVTKSLTVNGETKTTSKSAFMCYSGENVVQANNTMSDMEALFREMTSQLRIEGFNVLNKFALSSDTNLIDHLALAGGDSGSSQLAIEDNEHPGSTSPKLRPKIKSPRVDSTEDATKEFPTPEIHLPGIDMKIEEQQQEEVRQIILRIKEQKSTKGLSWSNMDDVRSSGILNDMQREEIILQEGIFEIISSEASYNISLDILIDLFYKHELLDPNRECAIIDAVQKHRLFSNILLIKGVSLQLLKDLETRWSQYKPRILDLADIILKHAEDTEFEQQYVNYLAHQSYQFQSLKNLLQKDSFRSALQTIQIDPKCCKLSLDSFLALPMQRLTRLKLLIEVVLKLMNQSKELLKSIPENVVNNHKNALKKLKELLEKSEAKKLEVDQKIRLIHLAKTIGFGNGCKNLNIESNTLIKEGEIKTHLPQKNRNVLKKLSKKTQPSFYFIVLSDLVIIAKKKSDSKLLVLDYCDRHLVEATEKKTGQETTLLIKFRKSESGSITEPIEFDVLSIHDREQWIKAITS